MCCNCKINHIDHMYVALISFHLVCVFYQPCMLPCHCVLPSLSVLRFLCCPPIVMPLYDAQFLGVILYTADPLILAIP